MSGVLMVPADVEVGSEPDEAGKWVASRGDGRLFRVTRPLVEVLEVCREGVPVSELQDRLGDPWKSSDVDRAVEVLSSCGLVSSEDDPGPRRASGGRLRVNSLFSIQFAVLNSPRTLDVLRRLIPVPVVAAAMWVAGVVALLGVIVTSNQAVDILLTASSPQPVWSYVLFFVMLTLSVSLHEFFHAAALHMFGGRVRRIGVMLFYFSPAFFCDVTDAWRLPRRGQRTFVALAGSLGTTAIAGAAAVVFWAVPDSPQWVAHLVIALYVGSVANLIPFVKFDGYIALMTWLDIPFLRDKAMASWRRAAAGALIGRGVSEGAGPLMVTYGVLCSVFPVILLSMVATGLRDMNLLSQFSDALSWAVWVVIAGVLVRGVALVGLEMRSLTSDRSRDSRSGPTPRASDA